MAVSEQEPMPRHPLRRLARKDVLAGLMFMFVAAFGLWASRHYPVGTMLRMGTGYVPRLLCWVLLGLGIAIFVQGWREPAAGAGVIEKAEAWQPLVMVAAAFIAFGLTIERLGLVVSIALLIGIGGLANRELRLIETVIAAVVLIACAWLIFVVGLGLVIPVWPEW
jgi:hypothetical protein